MIERKVLKKMRGTRMRELEMFGFGGIVAVLE